jgi:S1-C subfamily serine protease
MAKQPPKSEPPPSSPRVAAPPSGGFMLVHRLLKLAAFAVGLPATVLSGMALIGAYTESGYARAIGAGLVALAVPLFVADRLLPAHDPARARGLVSDVCCVTWALAAFAFVGLAHAFSGPLLAREGDRLVSAGYGELARVAYVLAGVSAEPAPLPPPAPSTSPSGSASAPLPAADAGASSATVDAGAAPDAGTPRPKSTSVDKTPAELFKEVSPSVVSLTALKNRGVGGGTGFLIDRNGTVATNHHVIADATAVRVKFQGGAIFDAVEVLIDDPTVDLALLRIDLIAAVDGGSRADVAPLSLGNSDDVVVGERAVVIGNPLGLDHTLTDGLVSSRRTYEGRPWIQFSAPIGSGNSGGPLFNMRGEVIGVCTASLSGIDRGATVAQNLNLAVPVNDLRKVIRTEYPARRKLGDPSAPGRW